MNSNFDYVFAVPGENRLIDTVREDGRSAINGETLDEVRQRYPTAERYAWEDWRTAQAAKQNTPIEWTNISADTFNEMLEVLPPIDWNSRGFLVGEPTDHSLETGRPRYQAFRQQGDRYTTSSRPLTRAEWRAVA